MDPKILFAAYVRQQKELSLPDIVLPPGMKAGTILGWFRPAAVRVPAAAEKPRGTGMRSFPEKQTRGTGAVTPPSPGKAGGLSRVKKLTGVMQLQPTAVAVPSRAADGAVLSHEEKRAALAVLLRQGCSACPLAKTRRKLVFGAGNVSAPLMIVGEAPGADEDEQGMPFVGAAGRILTGLCEAIALDRKHDVFITNVLKCRPPDNRTPGSAEVAACLPLLQKQIEIISPRLLLLLGKVAAHALLELPDGVGKLRGRMHEYRGIPALVTYHPAALLRNDEYRKPAEEDFKKALQFIKGNTIDGTSR
ncbi:MAG: uracil-DNA glycosylase [Chitinispirillaceae bacterium]|nr:uracil-DNA glycosylase [Chitinispirillaceae bacterium]